MNLRTAVCPKAFGVVRGFRIRLLPVKIIGKKGPESGDGGIFNPVECLKLSRINQQNILWSCVWHLFRYIFSSRSLKDQRPAIFGNLHYALVQRKGTLPQHQHKLVLSCHAHHMCPPLKSSGKNVNFGQLLYTACHLFPRESKI